MFKYQPCKISSLLHNPKFTCADVDKWLKKYKKPSETDSVISEKHKKVIKTNGAANKRKIHKIQIENILRMRQSIHYRECIHPNGKSCEEDNCQCIKRGFCEKYCLCSQSCPLRYFGCTCKAGGCNSRRCQCYCGRRDCDEDLCQSIFFKIFKTK